MSFERGTIMNKLLKVASNKVDYGFLQHRIIPGYVLENGIVLLDEERDEQGRYIGGVGMDGMYLRTDSRYTPVLDKTGTVTAFWEERA